VRRTTKVLSRVFLSDTSRYSSSPPHRERSRHVGHKEKRDGLPHVGDYFHKPLVCTFFLVVPSLPRLLPLHRRWICRPFQRLISSLVRVGTVVAASTLAGRSATAASPARPRTRRQIRLTSTHTRCSTTCQVGAICDCSLPRLPRLNFNHSFCFRHG
jgi:hypothetical protein